MCITCSDLAETTSTEHTSLHLGSMLKYVFFVTAPIAPLAYPNLATAARVSATSGTQLKSLPQETLLPALPDAIVRRLDGRENDTDTGLWRNWSHVGSIQVCLHLSNHAAMEPKWRLFESQFRVNLIRLSRDFRTRSGRGRQTWCSRLERGDLLFEASLILLQ